LKIGNHSSPREEGWLRHQTNFGEGHLSAADGVVAHTTSRCESPLRPLLIRTLRGIFLMSRPPHLTRRGMCLPSRFRRFPFAIIAVCFLFSSCQSGLSTVQPIIEFTTVPPTGPGGPTKTETIAGRVTGARPEQRIVLYAKSGQWWVQPFANAPYTSINSSSAWSSPTHLGSEYAALLVDSKYVPPAKLGSLPMPGNGVLSVAVASGGGQEAEPLPASLHFSGYDWDIRQTERSSGPKSAWTDSKGWLHLRINQTDAGWQPAEVMLRRSLGYGSYRLTIQDVSHLEPAAAMSISTFDESDADPNHRQIVVEISRWGDPLSKNAQYVIQPYYVPANVVRFDVPAGRVDHSFRWQPGRVLFQTVQETASPNGRSIVAENTFTSGVPVAGGEQLHLNLYVYSKPRIPMEHEVEVVIEKFEYLP
jgi:hypothetical protein